MVGKGLLQPVDNVTKRCAEAHGVDTGITQARLRIQGDVLMSRARPGGSILSDGHSQEPVSLAAGYARPYCCCRSRRRHCGGSDGTLDDASQIKRLVQTGSKGVGATGQYVGVFSGSPYAKRSCQRLADQPKQIVERPHDLSHKALGPPFVQHILL